MIPLLCVAVSAAALYYVFHLPELLVSGPEKTRASYLRERKEVKEVLWTVRNKLFPL